MKEGSHTRKGRSNAKIMEMKGMVTPDDGLRNQDSLRYKKVDLLWYRKASTFMDFRIQRRLRLENG